MQKVRLDYDRLWADIQSQCDLGQIILRRVERASRSNGGWKSLCPFHDDNNPSFSFSDDGAYYCFACQKRGNIYTFIREDQGLLEHQEIMERLAEESGLSPANYLDEDSSEIWKLEKEIQSARGRCQDYFRSCLTQAHLDRAGKPHLLTPANVADFGLGYCGKGTGFFEKAGKFLSKEAFLGTGLALEKGGRMFLFPSDHLMFPVYSGDTLCGWTGRNLSYSESPIDKPRVAKWIHVGFEKSRVCYGLETCPDRAEIAVLVEGPWDVLGTRIAVPEAACIAVLGSSPSTRTFSRLEAIGVKHVVLCLDSDSAGAKGAKGAIRQLLNHRQSVRSWPETISVAQLPLGEDPGSLAPGPLRSALLDPSPWATWWISTYSDDMEGVTALRKELGEWKDPPYEASLLVEAARSLRSPMFASEVEQNLAGRSASKQRRKSEPITSPLLRIWINPYLDCPPMERDYYRARIKEALGLDEAAIEEWNRQEWRIGDWGHYPDQQGFLAFLDVINRSGSYSHIYPFS